MFVTRNTEYHLRFDECVGVRDRETGQWQRHHAALRLRAVRLPSMGNESHWVGQRIQFWGMGTDVLTSPVVDYGRPERDCTERYCSLERSGEIVMRALGELVN